MTVDVGGLEGTVLETYKSTKMKHVQGEGHQAALQFFLELRGWGFRWKKVLHEGGTAAGRPLLILKAGSSGIVYSKIRITNSEDRPVAILDKGCFSLCSSRVLQYNGSTFYWKLKESFKQDLYQLTDVSGTVLAKLFSKNIWRTNGTLVIYQAAVALPRELIIATGLAMQSIEEQRRATAASGV